MEKQIRKLQEKKADENHENMFGRAEKCCKIGTKDTAM